MKASFSKEKPAFPFLIFRLAMLQERPVRSNSGSGTNQNNGRFPVFRKFKGWILFNIHRYLGINFDAVGQVRGTGPSPVSSPVRITNDGYSNMNFIADSSLA